jgi:hypothetical protein
MLPSTIWSVIPKITSGVALLAFVVAIAAWMYRTRLVQRGSLIRSATETDRARLVESALEFFHINTEGLSRDQKYQLALQQIRARERRFFVAAAMISLAGILLAIDAAYAIARTTANEPASHALSRKEERKRIDEEIRYRVEPTRNLITGDSINPLVQAELSFVVFTSTPPSQHDFLVSRRRNVYTEFLDRNIESLFIELADLVPNPDRQAVERGRDAVRRFDDFLHDGPKREISLSSHFLDDITILTRAQFVAVRDTLIPELRPWLP